MLNFPKNLLTYGPSCQESTLSMTVYKLDEEARTDQSLVAAV